MSEIAKIGERYAQVYINHEGKIATIQLCDKCYEVLTNIEIDRIAFHEVWEVMLVKLSEYALYTFADDVVADAVHRIIITMENTIFVKERVRND